MRPQPRPPFIGLLFIIMLGINPVQAATAPIISNPSADQIVFASSLASLNVDVTGDPVPILQWRRDGSTIAGATMTPLTFNPTLNDSGSYTVLARNIAGAATSTAMKLVVVDGNDREVPGFVGKTARLRAPTLAKGVTFHWQKDGADIAPSTRISGITASELVITKVQESDAGGYTCTVTSSAGALTGGQHYLVPVSRKPVIVEPLSMYDYANGAVAQNYAIDVEAEFYPDSFSITGLPPGLTVNTRTGQISGAPRKSGTFHAKVTATNAVGTSDPVYYDLTVAPLDPAGQGTLTGLWPADDTLNNGLGGRCTVTMTSSGAFTASLVLGTRSYSAAGTLMPVEGSAPVGVVKLASSSPMYFTVTPDAGLGLACGLTNDLTYASGLVIGSACRKPLPNVANAGRYTFYCGDSGMGSGASNVGWFTLSSAGVVSGAMRLIDGVSVTLGGRLNTDWNFPVFTTLYNGTGCLRGAPGIDSYPSLAESTSVSGSLAWFKKPQTAATRSFMDGFNVSLSPRGYGWPVGAMTAFAKFQSGTLNWSGSTYFTVTNGTGRFAALYSDDNTRGWKTFSINGSTGFWSGSGTDRYYPDYYDQTKHIDRSFTALGLAVRDGYGVISCPGHVRMVDLPDTDLGTTLATSPMGYYPVSYTAGSLQVVGGSYTGGTYSGGITISGGTLTLSH